eukprot:3130479-Amphidinium_carterae.1
MMNAPRRPRLGWCGRAVTRSSTRVIPFFFEATQSQLAQPLKANQVDHASPIEVPISKGSGFASNKAAQQNAVDHVARSVDHAPQTR